MNRNHQGLIGPTSTRPQAQFLIHEALDEAHSSAFLVNLDLVLMLLVLDPHFLEGAFSAHSVQVASLNSSPFTSLKKEPAQGLPSLGSIESAESFRTRL